MNKLEKVAIRRAKKTGRPLVMVFNNIHLFKNDDEGKQLLQQLQQRAESWAESGMSTVVLGGYVGIQKLFYRHLHDGV